MWRLVAFLIFIFPALVRADDFYQHVTFDIKDPPGSAIIKYGGIEGLIVDEVRRQLYNVWTDQLNLYWTSGHIDFSAYMKHSREIALQASCEDVVGNWWDRKWFDSIGALTPPRVYRVGRQESVADFGFFEITNSWKFKLREYKIELVDTTVFSAKAHSHRWDMRVRPNLKISTSDIVRNVELALIFNYWWINLNIIEVEVFAGFDVRDKYYGGAGITLPLW